MDKYRDTAARERQEARAAAWCVPVADADVVLETLLASTPALARRDFYRAPGDSSPPFFRRVLFARAGVPPSVLTAFDAACTEWCASDASLPAFLRDAVSELTACATAPLTTLSPPAACCAVEAALTRANLAAHGITSLVLYRGVRGNDENKEGLILATTSLAVARRHARGHDVVCWRAVPPERILMCHHTNGALSPRAHAYAMLCDASSTQKLVRTPPATRRERILCALLRVRLYLVSL